MRSSPYRPRVQLATGGPESWLSSVGLYQSDAQWWAKKEWWYIETCGATLPYLQQLLSVLTEKMSWPKGLAIPLMFEYAISSSTQIICSQCTAFSYPSSVSPRVKPESKLRSFSRRMRPPDRSAISMGCTPAKVFALAEDELEEGPGASNGGAVAGCEFELFERYYHGDDDVETALEKAIPSSFHQASRYADDGRNYTAWPFKEYCGGDWVARWTASPVAQKVAEDGKAYSAAQFFILFTTNGCSDDCGRLPSGGNEWARLYYMWDAATWATQRRIAAD